MSDGKDISGPEKGGELTRRRGPSLALIYGLIFLAMLVATVVAAFILLPFYHRH